MMLSPTEVNQHWTHPDPDVRRLVRKFFTDNVDPTPATMDDFWKGIDAKKLSPANSRDERIFAYGQLRDRGAIPWTRASFERFVDEIENVDHSLEVHASLRDELIEMDLRVVFEHRDLIFGRFGRDQKMLRLFKKRFELLDRSPADLWRELDSALRSADEDAKLQPDHLYVEHLLSAMRPHGEALAAQVIQQLSDDGRHWLQLACVQLLGDFRQRSALETLLQMLQSNGELDDELFEVSILTVASVCGVEGLTIVERFYKTATNDVRRIIAAMLLRIKSPEAEQLLMRLADRETEPYLLAEIGFALCALCTTDGALTVDRLIREAKYDLEIVELEDELSIVARLTGFRSASIDEWNSLSEQQRRDRFRAKTPGQNELRKMMEALQNANLKSMR